MIYLPNALIEKFGEAKTSALKTTGFSRFNGSLAVAIRESLRNDINNLTADAHAQMDLLRKSCKATPYNPFTIIESYLESIDYKDNPAHEIRAGVTPVGDDDYSKTLAKRALTLIRALLAIVATASNSLDYDDVNLQDIEDNSVFKPLRTILPPCAPIIAGRQFTAASTVRCLYITVDGRKVYFAFASPYSIIAPIFDGIDKLIESGLFPWIHTFVDEITGQRRYAIDDPALIRDTETVSGVNIRNTTATFVTQLNQHLQNACTDMTNSKFKRYTAILSAFIADLEGVVNKNEDYSALCRTLLQESIKETVPIIGGRQFIFMENGIHVYEIEIDGEIQHKTINTRYIARKDNDICEADLFLPNENAVVLKTSEHVKNDLIDSAHIHGEYLIPQLISGATATIHGLTMHINRAVPNGSKLDFDCELHIPTDNVGTLILRHTYSARIILEANATNVAIWPPVSIPECSKYYIFNSLDAKRDKTEELIVSANPNGNFEPFSSSPDCRMEIVSEFPSYLYLYDYKNGNRSVGRVKVNVETVNQVGGDISYAIDLGTSNTTIYRNSMIDGIVKKRGLNSDGKINSRVYASDLELINAFFAPTNNCVSATFQTLLLLKKSMPQNQQDRELFRDYYVHFRSGIASEETKKVLQAMTATNADWRLSSDIKWSDSSNIKFFLTELLAMILVETRIYHAENLRLYFTYPLSYSSEEKDALDSGIRSAINELKNRFSDTLVNKYIEVNNDGTIVGVNTTINESEASIIFCTNGDVIRLENQEANRAVAVLDVGGGTTDIAVARVNNTTDGERTAWIETTSLRIGARKMFIENLCLEAGSAESEKSTLFGRAASNDNLNDNWSSAYDIQLENLYRYARAHRTYRDRQIIDTSLQSFTAEFEYMLNVNDSKIANNLSYFQSARLYNEGTDKLRIIRTIMALELFMMSYCAGLLIRKHNDSSRFSRHIVMAGNGSRVFNILKPKLKERIASAGFNLGMDIDGGQDSNLLVARNDTCTKQEVAMGALSSSSERTTPEKSIPAGVFYSALGIEHNNPIDNVSVYDFIKKGTSSISLSNECVNALLGNYNKAIGADGTSVYGVYIDDRSDMTIQIMENSVILSRDYIENEVIKSIISRIATLDQDVPDKTLLEMASTDQDGSDYTPPDSDYMAAREAAKKCKLVSPMQTVFDALCFTLAHKLKNY